MNNLLTEKISKYFLAGTLYMISGICIAEEFQVWKENLECGNAKYEIESKCKPSKDELTLNKCKQQTLKIKTNRNTREIKLPELTKYSTKIIQKNNGDIERLFVIGWTCTRLSNSSAAVLYYSIGGGSSPSSESDAVYDEDGNLLNETNKNYKQAINKTNFQKLNNVRSIMPGKL